MLLETGCEELTGAVGWLPPGAAMRAPAVVPVLPLAPRPFTALVPLGIEDGTCAGCGKPMPGGGGPRPGDGRIQRWRSRFSRCWLCRFLLLRRGRVLPEKTSNRKPIAVDKIRHRRCHVRVLLSGMRQLFLWLLLLLRPRL